MSGNILIQRALEYYDKNIIKYESIFKKIDKIKYIKAKSDIERPKLLFYDNKNKIIMESEFEQVGKYIINYKLWIWAWANISLEKNKTMISRQILKYGLDLDISEAIINRFLKLELITSRFKVDNLIQLDIHIALVSYLSKNQVIYPYPIIINDKLEAIEYLFLVNIKII